MRSFFHTIHSCCSLLTIPFEKRRKTLFFPRASERRVLPIVGVCISSSHLHIFSSSHLHIFTSSHLHIFSSSHLPIFTLSHHLDTFTSSHLHISSSSYLLIFTSSHLHIFSSSHLLIIFTHSHLLIFTPSHLHIFSSSHLLIFTSAFTSSHLHICFHIFSSSHLLIFTSSHPHIFTSHIFSSSHLHIFTSSHLHIFSSCLLALLPSCPHIFTSSPFVLLPSCLQAIRPIWVSLDVIIPSQGGITPEQWKQTATLCPLDWPTNYSLLRLWHLPTSLHQFANLLYKQLDHRHMFMQWSLDLKELAERAVFQQPATYFTEAALQEHWRVLDFPSRKLRRRPPTADLAAFRAKQADLRHTRTTQPSFLFPQEQLDRHSPRRQKVLP